eukprot:COSAG04_NODE_911_length_9469_cov_11.221025_2_plen_525_part_00
MGYFRARPEFPPPPGAPLQTYIPTLMGVRCLAFAIPSRRCRGQVARSLDLSSHHRFTAAGRRVPVTVLGDLHCQTVCKMARTALGALSTNRPAPLAGKPHQSTAEHEERTTAPEPCTTLTSECEEAEPEQEPETEEEQQHEQEQEEEQQEPQQENQQPEQEQDEQQPEPPAASEPSRQTASEDDDALASDLVEVPDLRPPAGLPDLSHLSLELPEGRAAQSPARQSPARLEAGWSPSADVGAALVAKAQSKLSQQAGAWTPSRELGTHHVAKAEERLARSAAPAQSPTTRRLEDMERDDEDLSRALRNYRAKRSQETRSVSWASRLPVAKCMANVLEEVDIALSTMRVWKVADRRGRDHLVSLRHFSRQSELRVDGVRTATVAHSMWRDDDLLLPFTINDDQHGNVRIKQSLWSQPVYQCILEDGQPAEETSLLPPSSLIQKICVPRYEVRSASDGTQHVAFAVTTTLSTGSGDAAPAEEIMHRFSDFARVRGALLSRFLARTTNPKARCLATSAPRAAQILLV